MKFDVTVTRTRTEIASFEVSASDAETAEQKVRSILEPDYSAYETGDIVKLEKKAQRYFTSHLSESGDDTTEFEYEAEEL